MKKRIFTSVMAACMLLAGCSAPAQDTAINSETPAQDEASQIITADFRELDFKNLDSKSFDEEAMRKYFMRFVP